MGSSADKTESDELELGLGLSLGGGGRAAGKASGWGECGRILTAKDFPSQVKKKKNNNGGSVGIACPVTGTKRTAESVSNEAGGSPPGVSQVVGWPPIRSYRINSLVNQAKAQRSEEEKVSNNEKEKSSKDDVASGSKKKICNGSKTNNNENGNPIGFVKVNMDGVPIGRKVDLNAHASYGSLALTLEDMFLGSAGEKNAAKNSSKLLDGSSEFVLTYEDKEGDWMLVGDVPWRMFITSVKRLRIMRTSEANGLGPRFQETKERQRAKPV